MEKIEKIKPDEEDIELFGRWLASGGKKDLADITVDKMLEKYNNIQVADTDDEFLKIKHKLEQEGWEQTHGASLNLKTDFADILKEEIGNPDYKIVIWNEAALVFVSKDTRKKLDEDYVKGVVERGLEYLGTYNSRDEVPTNIRQIKWVQLVERHGRVFAFKESDENAQGDSPEGGKDNEEPRDMV